MGQLSPSSDAPEEGDVLITVTDDAGRVRVGDRQLERNVLRKKTAARYPQSRYGVLARQVRVTSVSNRSRANLIHMCRREDGG